MNLSLMYANWIEQMFIGWMQKFTAFFFHTFFDSYKLIASLLSYLSVTVNHFSTELYMLSYELVENRVESRRTSHPRSIIVCCVIFATEVKALWCSKITSWHLYTAQDFFLLHCVIQTCQLLNEALDSNHLHFSNDSW